VRVNRGAMRLLLEALAAPLFLTPGLATTWPAATVNVPPTPRWANGTQRKSGSPSQAVPAVV
jgi:hypothetical protein